MMMVNLVRWVNGVDCGVVNVDCCSELLLLLLLLLSLLSHRPLVAVRLGRSLVPSLLDDTL